MEDAQMNNTNKSVIGKVEDLQSFRSVEHYDYTYSCFFYLSIYLLTFYLHSTLINCKKTQ